MPTSIGVAGLNPTATSSRDTSAMVSGTSPAWTALAPTPSSSNAPYRIYNIGNNRPVKLMRYIEVLEQCLGRKAKLDLLPLQAGDVPETIADVSRLEAAVGFKPATPIEAGIGRFVEWYRSYYRV